MKDEAGTLPTNVVPEKQQEEDEADSSWTAASEVRLAIRWRKTPASEEDNVQPLRYADVEYGCEF